MYKIGVIGDRDSILGFKSVGLDIYTTTEAAEARKILRTWAEGEYAIIYITEELVVELEKEIDRYEESKLPAVIPIPNRNGPSGSGLINVKKAVEKAVGADILFGGDK